MKKTVLLLIKIICVIAFINTSFCANLWFLLTENDVYKIPKESSIFTFEATKMNEGSGGWWLYGEDYRKYYALSMEEDNIISFDKENARKIEDFDKLDYKTWK